MGIGGEMDLVCSDCGFPIKIQNIQQFGYDVTIQIEPCLCCGENEENKLEELEEKNKFLEKQLAGIKSDIVEVLDRYGLAVESEGDE